MGKIFIAPLVLAAVLALAGCETTDGDWGYSDTSSWSSGSSSSSGDNRSHQQRLSDQAWWDEYNR